MKLHMFDRTIRYVLYINIYIYIFFFFNLTLSITVKESARLACFHKMVIEMTMLFLLLMTKSANQANRTYATSILTIFLKSP